MPGDVNGLLHGTLDLLVLKAVSWGPIHGYAISTWIEQRTRDELEIVDSALYKAKSQGRDLVRISDESYLTASTGVRRALR